MTATTVEVASARQSNGAWAAPAAIDAGNAAAMTGRGDRLWLVDLVAPFATPENKLTQAMLADLAQNVFTGKKFKLHLTDPRTGKREIQEIGG